MKQILKSLLSVVLVLLVVILGFIVYGNYNETKRQEAELAEEQATPTPEPTPEPTPTPEPDGFTEPANAVNINLAVCGDVVCHTGLNNEAKTADGYDYTNIFAGASNYAQNADYAICTIETTFPETSEYTGYPMFKSPPQLAASLKAIGFDLINTASNHSMDGWKSGLDKTIDVLEVNGLDHIGTYRSQEERDATNGIVVKDINGISVAFLSYTYGTNGIPLTGFDYAVNLFFNDYMTTLSDVNYERLSKDMEAARALDTDIILVQMHWGLEYEIAAKEYQTELADFLFKEGADIIIGGHPHVPEPMELRHVVDNEGNEKTGFIVYSMGNFVSCQEDRYTDLTGALNIQIQKDLDTGKTYLRNISYAPLIMMDLNDYGVSASYRYMLWDLHSAIDSYKNGNNLGVINDTIFASLEQGLTDIHSVFGEQFDYVNGGVDAQVWAEENK